MEILIVPFLFHHVHIHICINEINAALKAHLYLFSCNTFMALIFMLDRRLDVIRIQIQATYDSHTTLTILFTYT